MPSEAVILFLLAAVGGLFAGMVSTAVGLGGGIAMMALLSLVVPVQDVVVMSGPITLVGTASRTYLMRAWIDFEVAKYFLIGGVPAAIVGARVLTSVPERALQLAMAGFLVSSMALELTGKAKRFRGRMPASGFLAVGSVAGFVTSTVGGTGPMVSPFMLARNLERQHFVGTMAIGYLGLNITRTSTYAVERLYSEETAAAVVVAALAMMGGNLVGRHLLDRISAAMFVRLVAAIVLGASSKLMADALL